MLSPNQQRPALPQSPAAKLESARLFSLAKAPPGAREAQAAEAAAKDLVALWRERQAPLGDAEKPDGQELDEGGGGGVGE